MHPHLYNVVRRRFVTGFLEILSLCIEAQLDNLRNYRDVKSLSRSRAAFAGAK